MTRLLRSAVAASALLALVACSNDGSPTASVDTDLAALTIDAEVGAAPGQASFPGITLAPDPTYQGSVAPTDSCAYVPSTGRVECAPVTREGLTITRSFAFYDAAGAAQTHRDSLTRSTNTRVAVSGTTSTPRGPHTVNRSSSITVSGLGRESTKHTIDGTEQGTTTATLTTDLGTVTVTETFSSATAALVIPAPFTATSWPLSGTITRQSTLTATRGSTTKTSSASEKVTFNGTSVVNVVITRNGTTKSCTRDLAARTTTCS